MQRVGNLQGYVMFHARRASAKRCGSIYKIEPTQFGWVEARNPTRLLTPQKVGVRFYSRTTLPTRLNRDLLIYLLWSTGWYNNQEIGKLFGLGYSSISRRVTIMKSKISKEDEMNKQLENIKPLIKVGDPF